MENRYKKLDDLIFVPLRVFLTILLCMIAIRFFPAWVWGVSSYLWPTTEGIIIEKELEAGRILYKPIVRYRYTISGVTYKAENLDFTFLNSKSRWAENKIAAYSANQSVRVRYNPFNPKLSCLIAGTDIWGHLFAALLLLMLMQPAMWCIRFYRKIIREKGLRYHPVP